MSQQDFQSRDSRLGLYLVLPAVMLVILVVILPIISGIQISLTSQRVVGSEYEIIGLKNYFDLFKDKNFIASLGRSAVWVLANGLFQTFVALMIALLINQPFKGQNFVRTWIILKVYNTFVYGFLTGLYINTYFKITESNVLILGAGGSARAVLLSLMDAEAKSICIANRTLDNAELLQRRFDERSSNTHVIAISDPKFLSYVQNADVIVNCTTIGMKNTDGILPFTDSDIHSETILYDLVYNPLRTLMLREGEKANCTVIGGIDMLVYQGAKAFLSLIHI